MTTRRDALVALPLVCGASATLAQASVSGVRKRMGVITLWPDDTSVPLAQSPFYVGLREKGWILSENLLREFAYADGKPARLAGLAEGLVRSRVDLIVAEGTDAAIAAARATRTIPIVFHDAFWPRELGLVESESRPGRNITGITSFSGPEIIHKRLELLKAAAPASRRAAWFVGGSFDRDTVSGARFDPRPSLRESALSLGYQTEFRSVRELQDLDRAFAEMVSWRADAFSGSGPQLYDMRQRLVELLMRHRMPSTFLGRHFVEAGGLMSYAPSQADGAYRIGRRVDYVDRILRGASPAELPVEGPKTYELVINMKTADALGLKIPHALLVQAEELVR